MAFPLDPAGRFHVPEFIVREKDGVYVAIDFARANWVCLNRPGIDLLRSLPGKTLSEAVPGFAGGTLPAEEAGKGCGRSRGSRAQGLSTVRSQRARGRCLLKPEAHEVWIVSTTSAPGVPALLHVRWRMTAGASGRASWR
jgi:hypothetical protein